MKILNLILFNLLLLNTTYAQNDYHNKLLNQLQNEYNLSGGTFVFGDNEAAKFNAFDHYNSSEITDEQRMSVSEKSISNQPFTKAFEQNTPTRLPEDLTSKVGSIIRNQQAVEEGDNMLLVFWAKGISNYLGFNGMAKVGIKGNGYIYKQFTYFNDEWTQYLVPMKANEDYDTEELAFLMSFGYRAQTVQFGGVALINYGSADLSKIPDKVGPNSYQGISPDASWRSPAKNRIENFRKADLKVKVVDQNNNPIDGAEVKVNMNQHHFGFGTAVDIRHILPENNSDDARKYREKLFNLDGNGHGFNEAVFENSLEWKKWEGNIPNSITKEEKVDMLQYLKDNGMKVRGHSLLWPGWRTMPPDIEDNSGNPSYLKNRIEEHIQSILQHEGIKNELSDWDAINEITVVKDIENSLGGREFYGDILRLAKQYAPNTPMYLNDYMTISYGGMGDKFETCKRYLKEIEDSGAPFDGIGFQAHLRDSPVGIPTVYSILEDFNQTFNEEKDLKITEFDMVEIEPSIQYQYMKDFLTIAFSHEKLKSFMMWGFWDGEHWKDNAPLFYENWNLKPSGKAFVDLVFNEWWTNEQVNSNGSGLANFNAFKGKHTITATYNGERETYDVELTEDESITIKLNVEVTDPDLPEANIFYVSNSGDDDNIGSEAQPWKTIQHAANVLRAGDKVIIKSGTYKEAVFLKQSGEAPDRYISFIGEGEVLMQGNPDLNSAFESDRASYISIEGIIVQDYHREGIAFYGKERLQNIRIKNLKVSDCGISRGVWDHGILVQNCDNFIVDNCDVYNSQGNNIHIYECSNGAVTNSTANGPENGAYRDDSDGIAIQNSERIVVRNCVANFNFEDGIDIGGYEQDGKQDRDIKHINVSNCITNYNKDDGLCFSVGSDEFAGADITFANCLSVGNKNHGLTCYQEPIEVKIVHNTIVDNQWGLKISNEGSGPEDFIIKNNIISQNTDVNFAYDGINTNTFEASNNNWYGNLPPNPYRGSDYQNENPKFQQPDFELKENSPCIDAGIAVTRTTHTDSGKSIKVEDSKYFCNGFGVVPGDLIDIAGQQVEVVAIPSETVINVSEYISWNKGDAVNFAFSGNAPDLGWKENLNTPVEQSLLGDVNCDGNVNSVDALFILQFEVGSRTGSSSCPLQSPANEIYLPNGDVNNDGNVNSVDALFILQCEAGIESVFCQDAGNRQNQIAEGLSNKRLKVFPNLFQDAIMVQYESNESSSHPKIAYITNIKNQVVREIDIPKQANWSTVLNVSDLTTGLYTLTLIDGDHFEILKLIKN